jgi:hypothetical protein
MINDICFLFIGGNDMVAPGTDSLFPGLTILVFTFT